jgi:hypothetical protein
MKYNSSKDIRYRDNGMVSGFMWSCCFLFFLLCAPVIGVAQVGIGTDDIDPSAMLHVVSKNNNTGVLFPRLTLAQRTVMTEEARSSGGVPVGLTFYCADCCTNEGGSPTGAMYFYNSVQWEQLDSDCEDIYTCNNATISIARPRLMDNTSIPNFTDGIANIETYDAGVQQNLRMRGGNKDRVNITFSEVLAAGTKIAFYYNTNQAPGTLGIVSRARFNGSNVGPIYRTLNTLPAGTTNTPVGDPSNNNFVLTITLTQNVDRVWVQSGTSEASANKVYFTEVKLFDANDVEIPLSCPPPPSCLDLGITIDSPDIMNPTTTPPLFTDGLLYDGAPSEQTDWELTRLSTQTVDVVNFDFNDTLPAGYQIVFNFYNGLDGIDVDLYNNGGIHQSFNSDVPPGNVTTIKPPASPVALDDEVTITLLADTDKVVVYDIGGPSGPLPSGNYDAIYLYEIRVFDLDGNTVPFSCP